MSFADELRKNYQTGNAPAEEVKTAQYLTGSIVSAVTNACQKISKHSRSLEGYYKFNYDEHTIVKADDFPKVFFYKEHLGKYSVSTLIHFNHNHDSYLNIACKNLIVENTRRELVKLGFSSVTVRAEEIPAPLKVGHTEFLVREKYHHFPAFRIYVKVSW